MAPKKLMDNPVLVIGILMMFIFLANYGPKLGLWESRSDKLRPTSCKATLVKLHKRIPANWRAFCEGKQKTNLAVEIQSSHSNINDKKVLRPTLYRTMANHLIAIAKNSPLDNLERVPSVRIRLKHPNMVLNGLTQGQYIVKLATLKDPKLIAEHLKVTVQVRETKK